MDEQNQPLTKRQRRILRKQQQAAEKLKSIKNQKIKNWSIIVVVVIIIGGAGYWAFGAFNKSANDSEPAVNMAGGSSDNPFLGGEQAGVVITEFSDFSCPACSAAVPVVKQLVSEYGDKIKIVFNGFNLNHKWSAKSLQAGECAYEQGKFWEFHDLVFARQSEWVQADDAPAIFKTMAGEIELNQDNFNTCLDSGKMSGEVSRDTSVAVSNNVNSTPSFMINDQKLVGVRPLEEFKKIIDEELGE